MADFKTHWQVGLGASVAGALTVSSLGFASPQMLPLLIAVGWIGSIAPDLDSDTGRPLRLIFGGLSFILPSALLWRIPWLHESPERAVLFLGLSVYAIHSPARWLFKTFTKHRGAIHSVPAALIFGGLCFLLAYHEDARRPLMWAVGALGSLGYLTHLILDELWSVDFNGTKLTVKRSFGSALSLRTGSTIKTSALYLTMALVWWACYRLWARLPFIPEALVELWSEWSEAPLMSARWWQARWAELKALYP